MQRQRRFWPLLALIALIMAMALSMPTPCLAAPEDEKISSVQDLNGRRIGVQTGTTFDAITLAHLPDAQLSYYNSNPDLAEALLSNKIDAFPADEPVIRLMAAENDRLSMLDEPLESFSFGVVFPKNEKGRQLQGEFNAWLAEINASGELERIISTWIEGTEVEKVVPDYHSFPAPKGTLVMASDGSYPPMEYYRDNKVVGIEVDLAARFCESQGYGLDISVMNFDGILLAVQTGKADFGMSGITITEERAESVLFSDPYYQGGTVMAVRTSSLEGATTDGGGEGRSFLEGLAESFQKTFLRENRWQLFGEGVVNTLVITVLSLLIGTALGFVVYMVCRNENPVTNAVAGFCMWLVQGTPVVVLLMILYYIVFGSLAIGGIAVSIVCFSLTFGTSVFGLLKMGVNAVDDGQREAAFAMGYSERQTFFKIILPQALPHVMPAYRGEIVSLIKATAVVGYIAVQDLTKMGDIVRSRTYEAFFPLIAVTVIYFLLEGLIGIVSKRVEAGVDPKNRKRARIMKGVETDD